MNHLEDELQSACVTTFRLMFPGRIIFAIPNGGKRNVREAARMKKQGVLAGVPDLCIPEPMNGFHGLYIEMKSQKGTLSPAQKEMIALLEERGYWCEVCKSFDEFMATVNKYFTR